MQNIISYRKYLSIILIAAGGILSIWNIAGYFNSKKAVVKVRTEEVYVEDVDRQQKSLINMGLGAVFIISGIAISRLAKPGLK